MGCDRAQGFLLGMPSPAEVVEGMLGPRARAPRGRLARRAEQRRAEERAPAPAATVYLRGLEPCSGQPVDTHVRRFQ